MKHLQTILNTEDHYTGLILRITLTAVILPHGCQVMLGWFNGGGYEGTMNYLTQAEGLPWIVAISVILLQFAGSLLILTGTITRLFAFATGAMFVGMVLTSHLEHGFFMNWYGTQKGEGYEYHLLVIGLCILLFLNGAGRYSVDQFLSNKIKTQTLQ